MRGLLQREVSPLFSYSFVYLAFFSPGCYASAYFRQYLCKSGEWMFRSRVKRSNRRSENDSSDENDYRPLAKWKPTARPVSQFLLGELKKGKCEEKFFTDGLPIASLDYV